jgi:hypothetical protein
MRKIIAGSLDFVGILNLKSNGSNVLTYLGYGSRILADEGKSVVDFLYDWPKETTIVYHGDKRIEIGLKQYGRTLKPILLGISESDCPDWYLAVLNGRY